MQLLRESYPKLPGSAFLRTLPLQPDTSTQTCAAAATLGLNRFCCARTDFEMAFTTFRDNTLVRSW
jgi:hypothetical protein